MAKLLQILFKKPNYSADCLNLSYVFLNSIVYEIAPVLKNLIQKWIDKKHVPACLKAAKILIRKDLNLNQKTTDQFYYF